MIVCRSDDLTGKAGRHGVDADGIYHPEYAAHGWRDYDWHIQGGELECKRIVFEIQDQATMEHDRKPSQFDGPADQVSAPVTGHLYAAPLQPNFGDPTQCAIAALKFITGSDWEQHNPGWGIVGIGCPTRIVAADENGNPIRGPNGDYITKGWKIPECPAHVPGHPDMPMTCKFDDSQI